MSICNLSKRAFYSFLALYNLVVLYLIFYFPYTKVEDKILIKNHYLTDFISLYIYSFSQSYIILRLFFFLISLISSYLLFKISKYYLKDLKYSYLALTLFLLTPGVFVSFVIVNYATLPIFLSLLFVYAYLNNLKSFQIISLVLLFFTNTAVFVFYLSVAVFSYFKKEWWLFAIALILLIFSSFFEKYPIDGIPKGYLVELFITYAITFSPLYFLAILYAIYRLAKDKSYLLLWYITSFFLIISLLLSIRQKISVTDFSPYIAIIAPLVVLIYKNSISIRLKQFRKKHILVCKIILITMFIQSSLIALSYPIYKVTDKKIKIINSRIYTIKK